MNNSVRNSPAYQNAWSKFVSDRLYSLWNSSTPIPVTYNPQSRIFKLFEHTLDVSNSKDFTLEDVDGWINEIYIQHIEQTARKEFDKQYPYV